MMSRSSSSPSRSISAHHAYPTDLVRIREG